MVASIAVYCSSSEAVPDEFLVLADVVGRAIAGQQWRLVYGGAAVGMMGRCADAALAVGGHVIGVMTRQLMGYEVGHAGLTELHVVESMHRRKEMMSGLADGVLVLPGGFGTLDETLEAITWRQLGIADRPIVFLDHEGFYAPLLQFFAHAAELRFIRPAHLRLFEVAQTVEGAIELLAHPTVRPVDPDKWWLETGTPPAVAGAR